ncbi:MAG: hypothetical protein NC483_00555 [Ruminococcus sp.]|nr:hypothetical protein [Ruminococcus sp.]
MVKQKKIDLKSVKETLKNMDSDKSNLGLSLLEEAEFMKITLDELKKKIKENGVVTSMCQGSYDIERANPALNQYNSLIKNYNSTIKQIYDMLPKGDNSNEDGFDDDDL